MFVVSALVYLTFGEVHEEFIGWSCRRSIEIE